jgi:hypothetical protein
MSILRGVSTYTWFVANEVKRTGRNFTTIACGRVLVKHNTGSVSYTFLSTIDEAFKAHRGTLFANIDHRGQSQTEQLAKSNGQI